ncbi:tetratricopeptide repeat protein [Actibacterium sp. 188UL27-1]|uniref:tetratricopeptide repeat protein n=1 Tax=Actibacterium sp. 188UL27-1 TaxID=2786961 RepID=UPI001958F75F|nr:tetratricopeptide repeat protein [Actibacterium sp. 188UL27-1]MBM7066763.1 tetratricopeptide repeat protein [Actibacterium sp. 188UL27-1]
MLRRLRNLFRKRPTIQQPKVEDPNRPPLDRLRDIRAMLWDTDARFSISGTFHILNVIKIDMADAGITDSETLGELAYCRGYLLSRNQQHGECIEAYQMALHHDDATPFLPEKQRLSARAGIALHQSNMERWDQAVASYRALLPDLEASDAYDENACAGTQQQLAYCLHEAEKYADALELNEIVLARGERLFGADAPELTTCLTNMAQNLYELKRLAEAAPILDRVLAIAEADGNIACVTDMLFQKGVLAHETGDNAAARTFMQAAIDRAEAEQDEDLAALTRAQLAELETRMRPKSV